MSDYFSRLDSYMTPEQNKFLSGSSESQKQEPLVSIKKLGATFGETTRGNILNSLRASIQQGSGQLQLALQSNPNDPLGGLSGVGKDQRQAIKELIKTSGIEWEGVEMPTNSITGVGGLNQQTGGFDERKRQSDLQHVKNAIDFTAEIGAGGIVDIWSAEFQRDISGASFQQKDDARFTDFKGFDENVHSTKYLVDERTGRVMPISTGQLSQSGSKISVPVWKRNEKGQYVDSTGKPLNANSQDPTFIMDRVPEWNPETQSFESKTMNWTEFKDYAKKRNQEEGLNYSPEEWFQRIQLETQYAQQRGQSIYHTQEYESQLESLNKYVLERKVAERLEEGKTEAELISEGLLINVDRSGGLTSPKYVRKSEYLGEQIRGIQQRLRYTHEASGNADAQAKAIWESMNSLKPVEEYAKEKIWDSYADLAVYAYEQTKEHKPDKPVAVGPELSFPQTYGSHTEEFIEIVQGARKKFVERMQKDSNFASLSPQEREQLAKTHIKGMLDTSHMTMWYNHFPDTTKDGKKLTEKQRLNRFNKWFLKQMDKLAEADVVGSVQIVDSATGDHHHLPVGQGIFPTVDAVKRLREKGWDGGIISEGHSEEQMDLGKIQYSLWNAFGASVGQNYHFGGSGGNSFGNIYSGTGGAAGYRAPPNFIVGSYAPSNDFKLWSDVNLE